MIENALKIAKNAQFFISRSETKLVVFYKKISINSQIVGVSMLRTQYADFVIDFVIRFFARFRGF